jgi:hypothetical protein
MALNMLSLNLPKTDILIIGTPQQRAKLGECSLEVCGNNITPSSKAKNLGAVFDSGLTYQSHVATVSRAAYCQLYNIQQVRPSLTREAASTTVHAFVTYRLDSANAVLYGLPKKVTYQLQKIQNAAARTLTGARKRDHITPQLQQLHWLPIKRRVEYKILVLAFKAKHGLAPAYFNDLVELYKTSRNLRSGDAHQLVEPRTILTTGGNRSFQKGASILWNSLPLALRQMDSINTYLFKIEYGIK